MAARHHSVTLGLLVGLSLAWSSPTGADEVPLSLEIVVDAGKRHQEMNGFGVNITPAQWRGGALKPALDLLVDDLGTSLVRLDCYGKANWLDPAQADPHGSWPAGYLASVYGSQVFTECWETFRYLTDKGADVHLNVSGRISPEWAGSDGETLVDFEAYAGMVVSLARWAREEEELPFTALAPFNETNLGFPEGPKIADWGVLPAVQAIVRKLDAAGLGDVKLILIGDAPPVDLERHRPLLHDTALVGRVAAFSHHTYGDGDEGDGGPGWYDAERPQARLVEAVAMSPHRGTPVWMTEYGDLDQSGLIEWRVAWRSTRRALKFLEDGFSAGLAWDGFDNLHEHDGVWATYGLLETNRESWTYEPKKRYFAAKQLYRFVRPGWTRVDVSGPPRDPKDVYADWHDPMRHLRLLGFVSPDDTDFTIVGMSRVEADVELDVSLKGLGSGRLAYYRTTRSEDCALVTELEPDEDGVMRVVVPGSSIFTLTTLR
jgi:hypothetical protein